MRWPCKTEGEEEKEEGTVSEKEEEEFTIRDVVAIVKKNLTIMAEMRSERERSKAKNEQ